MEEGDEPVGISDQVLMGSVLEVMGLFRHDCSTAESRAGLKKRVTLATAMGRCTALDFLPLV